MAHQLTKELDRICSLQPDFRFNSHCFVTPCQIFARLQIQYDAIRWKRRI